MGIMDVKNNLLGFLSFLVCFFRLKWNLSRENSSTRSKNYLLDEIFHQNICYYITFNRKKIK